MPPSVDPNRATHFTPGVTGGRWAVIQSLRQSADRHLAVIATRTGRASRLHDRCREVWGDWEREALVSILNRDYANAEVLLDRGVHSLRHALEVVQKERLTEDEMVKLIAAA
jgi:hypothetical protein